MSDTSAQLLATFESLSANEQHEVLVALLRRTDGLPESIVADNELIGLADELFQTLDAEEANANDTDAR